jgi:hypothetical protein
MNYMVLCPVKTTAINSIHALIINY